MNTKPITVRLNVVNSIILGAMSFSVCAAMISDSPLSMLVGGLLGATAGYFFSPYRNGIYDTPTSGSKKNLARKAKVKAV